jgi:TPR repeat protein
MIKMRIKLSQLFGICILALIAWSSAALADPKGDVELGQKALAREDIPEATKFFKKAAEQNYLPAQFMLGELQHSQDELEEAFGWYMTAAYQGDAPSAYGLGQMYVNGEGVEKNFEKGVYWIKLAAGKNYLTAQEAMVTAYKQGDWGLPVDLEQSKNWETKAIALRAVEKRALDHQIVESKAALKAANEAAAKAAAEAKEAGRKASDDAAAKKVDDADR